MLRMLIAGVLVVFACVNSAEAAGDDRSARGIADRLQNGIFEVLKHAKKLGVDGRYELILPVLERDAHIPLMTATASGPYWREGSKTQKERAIKAFAEMHSALLAALFDSYNGETYKTVKVRETGGKIVLVDSNIIDSDGEPTLVTFATAKIKGRWWVIDVIIAGGISEVKVKRNEFNRLLEEGGLDNLSAALERKKDRLLFGEEKAVR
jgi:phospholipid transport system substrate-binding protein